VTTLIWLPGATIQVSGGIILENIIAANAEKTNIVLIGMPGAGKSTVGVLLAKALKVPFIDTDLIIQQSQDRYLQEIIVTEGLRRFLEIEEATILGLFVQKHVIATGGSVVYIDKSMNYLSSSGVIVYIRTDFDEIERRINNISTRGIAMESGQTLQGLYLERVPLYEKYADMVIESNKGNIEEVVGKIKTMF
jgi:shikimate kinase